MDISNFIWYERHRPISLSELILPDATRAALEHYIETQDIPHLLLYGPAGSGKTTVSQILLKHLPCTSLCLNASSGDRGVDVMKTKVKQFAGSALAPNIKLKIVFFDEADGLTLDAQKALRNTIEAYVKTCRFIFTANYPDKILDPIRSRCTMFEFSQFSKPDMKRHVCGIMRKENITFDRDGVGQVVDKFYPDFRTILNTLQTASISGNFDAANIAVLNIDMNEIGRMLLDGLITDLRKYWVGISDFTFIYKWMFDSLVPLIAQDDENTALRVAILIADYLVKDAMIPDKELCVAACCYAVMEACGITPVFAS